MTPLSQDTTVVHAGEVIDVIAVERRLAGSRPLPRLTRAEKEWAVHRLAADGMQRTDIAQRVGVSGDTVRTILGQPIDRRELQPCGTPGAYDRHRRRGEKACRPCLDAHHARVNRTKGRR